MQTATCAPTSECRRTPPPARPPNPPSTLFQSRVQIGSRCLQRRRQSKHHAGNQRQQQRIAQARARQELDSRPVAEIHAANAKSQNAKAPRTTRTREPTRAAPPISASITLSVSNCRINLHRLAPTESRTAISLCRAVARASIKFATFAQAISSTKPKPTKITAAAPITKLCSSGLPRNVAVRIARDVCAPRMLLIDPAGDNAQVRAHLPHRNAWPHAAQAATASSHSHPQENRGLAPSLAAS